MFRPTLVLVKSDMNFLRQYTITSKYYRNTALDTTFTILTHGVGYNPFHSWVKKCSKQKVKEHSNSNSRSVVYAHISSCVECQSDFSKCFQRVDSGRNDIEVTIKEALHIKFSTPKLNEQLFNCGLSFALNIF